MAKYKSIVYADIRGKVNGLVYSRNTFGGYVRMLTAPVQPNTDPQSLRRQQFTELSRRWRLIAETQRAAWRALAQQVAKTDSLGESYNLTGNTLYISLNLTRLIAGLTRIDTPPPLRTVTYEIISATVNYTPSDTIEITLAPTPPSDIALLVEAAAPTSGGRNYIGRSEFRTLGVTTPPITLPLDITFEYNERFGLPAIGQRFAVRITPLSWPTNPSERGWRGRPVIARAVRV